MTDGLVETVNRAAEVGRTPFYDRASEQHLAPLWRVLGGLVTEEPKVTAIPALWRFDEVKPYLMEACELISTEEAERRVLVFENPGLRGQSRITPSLFAGYQIILPGEIAPAHRHVASALRFIIDGKDAYTAVAGERTMMAPGDFVITPSWTWHDHGNLSDGPMIWLDGLDMHIVNLLSASFRDSYPGTVHPIDRPENSAMAEAGSHLLPVDWKPSSQTSPIFNYRYCASREAIFNYSRLRDPDPCHGFKMAYTNPTTGGSAMPTISTMLQLIPKGFNTTSYRSTAGTVFSVIEGSGSVSIGQDCYSLGPKDLFVAPSWHPISFVADDDLVIFSYSDRVVQEKLDLFREMRGNV